MSPLFHIVALLALTTFLAMNFRPPTPAQSMSAIGKIEGLSETLQRALDPARDFAPLPVPRPGDWLAEHPESGQTFDDFVRSGRNRPDARRNKIYLQPLGAFPEGRSPSLKMLGAYAAAYFRVQAKVLPQLVIGEPQFTTRLNPHTGNRQILTGDVLILLKRRLPVDAFCALAITMEDLYPHPSWNFVFGQASFRERVGVFSFARYDPAFYGEKRGADYEEILLRRSCKVLAHETAHMFSLAHCIFYSCVVNGSNHLRESDERPLALCPVCLRKLQFSIGFDVVDRYQTLRAFYQEAGFDPEVRWVSHRLRSIRADGLGE
jgi:archaemetzincin